MCALTHETGHSSREILTDAAPASVHGVPLAAPLTAEKLESTPFHVAQKAFA